MFRSAAAKISSVMSGVAEEYGRTALSLVFNLLDENKATLSFGGCFK